MIRTPQSVNPWLSRPVEIESIAADIPGVATYHLRFRNEQDLASFQCRAGQFNMLYIPGVGEIPISLSGKPRSNTTWAHTVRVAGNVTRSLAALAPGDTLGLRGPFGSHWPLEQAVGRDVVLVAGGIGLAPLRAAIYELLAERQRYGRITLLYGSRSPASLLYTNEYDDWAAQDLTIQTTVDRANSSWHGRIGFVSLLLDGMRLPDARATVVLTCGPEVMMKYVVRSAMGRGISPAQIWCSLERNMQCAVGLCGHCQLGPEFICKDGPILRYDRVMPLLAVERL